MAASEISYDKVVGDVIECPICTEVIEDSRVLPCIHTFCLKCLEQNWKDKKPGDGVPCPLCRAMFNIPKKGLSDLPKNYSVEKLLDLRNLSVINNSMANCAICSQLNKLVKHCEDCRVEMCDQCANTHSRGTNGHQVVNLKEHSSRETSENSAVRQCDQHKDEKIKIYCLECETAVCPHCFIIKHNGHKCSDISEVIDDLKKQIRSDIEQTTVLFVKVKKQSCNLEKVSETFARNVNEIEGQIVRRGNEIKQLVDEHVEFLLQELNRRKSVKIETLEIAREGLHAQKTCLESFITYSQKVLDEAIPANITCVAAGLRTEARNLKDLKLVPVDKNFAVSFAPSFDLNNLFTAKNMIGEINISDLLLDSNSRVGTEPKVFLDVPLPTGIAMSDREIFVASYAGNGIQVFDSKTFRRKSSILVPQLVNAWDITISEDILFVGQESGLIHRIPLNSLGVYTWSVEEQLTLSTLNSGNILVTCYSTSKLIEYTITGQPVREIHLQKDITSPTHAIQMDNDRFLVCHAGSLHSVCLINNKGQLINSFGGTLGSGRGDLKNPCHMISDMNGFCLVADRGSSNRVVMLDDELGFVQELITKSIRLSDPIRTCLDRKRGRVFVADFSGARVVAFDLMSCSSF